MAARSEAVSPRLALRWHWAAVAGVGWAVGLLALFAFGQAPLGGISARLIAEETGRPIPNAQVILTPADPSVAGRKRRFSADAEGRFQLRRLCAGDYFISATSRSHRLPQTRLTVAEGRMTSVVLELAASSPFLDLSMPQHVFVPGEPVRVRAHGFIRGEMLGVSAYRLDPEKVMRDSDGSVWRVLRPGDESVSRWGGAPVSLADLPDLKPIHEMSVPLKRDSEGIFNRAIDVPVPGPGLYLLACRGDGMERLTWAMVTDVGLVTKAGKGGCLAYTVDLKTGAPAAGAEVIAYEQGQAKFTATTGDDGLLAIPEIPGQGTIQYVARRGESLAFVRGYRHSGEGEEEGQERLFLCTDRPVYRPGQHVYFKGVLRRLQGADFTVPAPGPVHVLVHDQRNTVVYNKDLPAGEWGSFDGGFDLSREAGTGVYTMTVQMGEEQHEHEFAVASYRKPEYSVEIKPEKESYVRGEPAWALLEARYFFGAPVAGAKIEYTVTRSPRWGWEDEEQEAEFAAYQEEEGEGEVLTFGEARTDANGRCRIRFETAPLRPKEERSPYEEEESDADHDYRYSVSASVTDGGRFSASGSTSVNVWRGDYALDVDTDPFVVTAGQPVKVTATVRDHDGKARADVPVELAFTRREWEDDGFKVVPAGSARATSDASGKVATEFKAPRAGSFEAGALVRDRRGNEIRATGYVWVSGQGDDIAAAHGPDLQIVADRKEYRLGDTATFLVNVSKPGATALITTEADGVMEHRLVPLRGRSTPVKVQIGREHLPNFSFCACFVRDKEFARQEVTVNVSPKPRALQVQVTPDKETYAPGETATYRVRTLGPDGRPVRAEVTLGIVDESIYAIQEDTSNILTAFYPRRYNNVETDFSFPQVYLSGPDKSGPVDSVRKNFPDTALWRPSLVTDANGEATVSLKMPDTLTQWRATARAHTMDTLVGQGISKATCRKPLMVRLLAPRFLTARDVALISAMVHNESGAEQQVRLALKLEGVVARDRPEVNVRLRPGQAQRFDWRVETARPGECKITGSARADSGLNDAMELTLPILPHGRARVEAHCGALPGDGSAEQRITVRPDATGETTVSVQLAPSLASGMLSALDFLARYPYGCTEQTMSCFLPDLVVHRAFTKLGMRSPRLEKQIPEMVAASLQRLYRFQHHDGGWGWWEFDDSDAGMTAYVVEGLVQARDAGFTVNPDALRKGTEWLLAHEREWSARADNVPAYQREALQRADEPQRRLLLAEIERARSRRDPKDVFPAERADGLLALAAAGEKQPVITALSAEQEVLPRLRDPERLARLVLAGRLAAPELDVEPLTRRLRSLAQDDGTFCQWKQDPEATALALQALMAGRPAVGTTHPSPLTPRPDDVLLHTVRWLLAHRDEDHWISTRATARVLLALVQYLEASGETAPDFQVVPYLNGKALPPVRFDRASVFSPEVSVTLPGAVPGENRVRLEKKGAGTLYYTVRAKQFIGQEDLPVLVGGSGITVERSYHRLQPQQDQYGNLRLRPAENAVTRLRAGEPYLGRIVIRSSREVEHVVLEEPIPAGCEPMDRGRLDRDDWTNWWTDVDVRDDQIAFFARRLPAGTRVLEYYLRPAVPGSYHVMPTQVSGMYDPNVRAAGAEARVEVR